MTSLFVLGFVQPVNKAVAVTAHTGQAIQPGPASHVVESEQRSGMATPRLRLRLSVTPLF